MSIVVSTRSHGSVGLRRPSLVGRWPGVLGAVSAWALIGCGAKSEPASSPATSPASAPAAATSASEPAATKPRTDKNDAKKEVVAVAFEAGVSREAELSFRRAGEPTLTLAKGTVVFDEGLMSGKASGTTEGGVKVELAWTCETGS